MRKHDFYYNSQPKTCTKKYVTLLILAIFCLAVTSFALLEVTNFYSDEPVVKRILLNSFKSSSESSNSLSNEVVIVNLKDQQEQQQNNIVTQLEWNSERQARAASDNGTNSPTQKSNSYYEEQAPVVVYSKTDMDSSIARRQMAEIPPRQDTDEDDPYSKVFDDDYEGRDDSDYFGQQVERQQEPSEYYKQQQQQQQQNPTRQYYSQKPSSGYYRQPQPSYRQSPPIPQYYDDSREDFPGPDSDQTNSEEARSSQYHDYDNNYRQYPYATASPIPAATIGNTKRLSAANSNMQFATRKAQPQYREPFPTYSDDYDYPPAQLHPSAAAQRPAYANRKASQQMPQYRTPSPTSSVEEQTESNPTMDYLTMFKSLKTMWDLYQSFTSSWNTLAERRNREEEIAKQKYKQMQQIRINSKKPPKFNTRRNTTTTNKNPRKQVTTSGEEVEEEQQVVKQQSMAKVELRKSAKGTKIKNEDVESLREKRQATDVAEGRYIKGDPLKGYYDFVITEGSYKFWAAFQVGTAILIIYSTFAAIYYSKVNPLVSDYDYTDYLGGARSLSGGDIDFVDDDEGVGQKVPTKSWLEWLPRTSHSLKFILDAIDKLPTDHAAEEGVTEFYKRDSGEELHVDESEYRDEIEPAAEAESSNAFDFRKENESLNENDSLNDTKQINKSM